MNTYIIDVLKALDGRTLKKENVNYIMRTFSHYMTMTEHIGNEFVIHLSDNTIIVINIE